MLKNRSNSRIYSPRFAMEIWGLRSSHCRAEETSPRRVSRTYYSSPGPEKLERQPEFHSSDKTRPEYPIPTLQARFDLSQKWTQAEGLLFLHGLESNPGSSLQTEEEAGLP